MSLEIKSLEHLFISKVRIKALKYFLFNPEASIHLRGAVREFNEEINAVRRELTRLEEMNFITAESKGNRKYFTANKNHSLFPELLGLFHKSYGLGGMIMEAKNKLGDIEFAFLTAAYTKNHHHGSHVVDLVIIGKIDMHNVENIIQKEQSIHDREIHYTVFSSSEFQMRKRRKDQFINDLIVQDLVMLIGTREDLIHLDQ